MANQKYDDMTALELDVMKEIGSIGSGNAVTALSSMLNTTIHMQVPEVSILKFNAAVKYVGVADEPIAAIMVEMSGQIQGMMMFMLKRTFIHDIVKKVLGQECHPIQELTDMETSLLVEVGNIMISSYITAMASLTGTSVQLSIPQLTVDMLGAILTVPMLQVANTSDEIMMVKGSFIMEGKEMESQMLLFPDVASLEMLMKKLGVR